MASPAEARTSREPEQQAVAQWEEHPAWRQWGSRASAQQRLAHRQPEHLASLPQRECPLQGLSAQEPQRPDPLQQQPA